MSDNEKLIPDIDDENENFQSKEDLKNDESAVNQSQEYETGELQNLRREEPIACVESHGDAADNAFESTNKIVFDCNNQSEGTVVEENNNDPEAQQTSDKEPPVEQHHNYYQQSDQYNRPYYTVSQDNNTPVRKKSRGKALFFAIACILLVCVVGIFSIVFTGNTGGNADRNNGLSDVPYVTVVSSADAKEDGLSAAEVYQKVFKSSVSVLAYNQASGELGVLGSGVICQEDTQNKYTYIVTCAHVINDTNYNIKVELWDGSVHTAEVVNFDDSNDIGVIRIAGTGLDIAEFGDSDEILPGATVYAIGSPYSSKFAGSFTRGMVSAVNRLVTTQTSYQLCCIQHDAPINHGNSGGALVNAYGQVIGINALKITAEGYEGLGFSVPSKTVIKVINSIIETGIAPKTPKLGISYVQAIYYSQFLSDFVEENNLPAGSIVIADITEDSSLYQSELQVNDIVTAVNGEALTTPDLLVQLIQNSNVGDSFELSVVRIIMNQDGSDYVDMQTFTVTATLVEKTDSDSSSSDDAQQDFYEYFGDDSGNYEDFYEYFYDYFYGNGNAPFDSDDMPEGDNRFSIPE